MRPLPTINVDKALIKQQLLSVCNIKLFLGARMTESRHTLRKESSDPLVINSVTIIVGWLRVTTPTSPITFPWPNCPMMLASVRKSSRFLSDARAFSVFIAITTSSWPGTRIRPLHTSPNSPGKIQHKTNLNSRHTFQKSMPENENWRRFLWSEVFVAVSVVLFGVKSWYRICIDTTCIKDPRS